MGLGGPPGDQARCSSTDPQALPLEGSELFLCGPRPALTCTSAVLSSPDSLAFLGLEELDAPLRTPRP